MGKKAKGSVQTLTAFDGGNAPTEKMSAARRRQLERRDTDEQVERDIQARFPNLCSSEIDVRLLDGKCLRDTIRDDKRLAKREGRKLGPKYWQLLSQKVASLTSHAGHLVVKNNTEPVDAKLCEAMKAMHSTNTSLRNRTLLTEWLATSKAPNQRTVVGVFKATQQSAPAANQVALLTVIDVMRWAARHNLKQTFSEEVGVMAEFFDRTLSIQLASMRRQGVSLASWWGIARDCASLVMDAQKVDAIFGADNNWGSVKAQLAEVTSGSVTGMKMFGFAMASLNVEVFSEYVDQELGKFEGTIDAAALDDFMDRCDKRADELDVDAGSFGPLELTVVYRGIDCAINVPGLRAIPAAKFACLSRELAVNNGQVKPLSFETGILGIASKSKLRVEDDLVSQARMSRELALEEERRTAPSTGDLTVAMLASKRGFFGQVDKWFTIDIALAQALSKGPGEQKLHDAVLELLPKAKVAKELKASAAQLDALCKSPLFKFTSRLTQGTLNAVLAALRGMERGYPPNMTNWNSTPFLRDVKDRLQYFFRQEIGEGHEKKEVTGASGVIQLLESVISKSEKKEVVKLSEVEPFSTFEWLLTEDLQAKAKAIICEVYSDSQRKPALLKRSILPCASSASASSSFVRPSYKKAKSMQDVSLEDVVMSMFD